MRIVALALSMIIVVASFSLVKAQVLQEKVGWTCGAPEQWEATVIGPLPNIILNNFYFGEADSFSTDMTVPKNRVFCNKSGH